MPKPTNTITTKKPKFSVMVQTDMYKNLINSTLGDPKRAEKFIASISSAVAVNPDLQNCEAGTILSGALLGESLNLKPSPALGHYYLVPYKDTDRGVINAVFQIGYKGLIQLAIRSGQYKRLNVIAVKEGELKSYNPLTEEIDITIVEDDIEREKLKTVGYYAMFELLNGFRKTIYWSRAKMESHAKRYSKGYQANKGYTFWEKDFDGMAFKTLLRQLISKWGVMSTDLEVAYESDMASLDLKGNKNYVDNDIEMIDESNQEELITVPSKQKSLLDDVEEDEKK